MCVAVIPCAGVGARFLNAQNSTIKQLSLLNDRPLFSWSLKTFLNLSFIKEIILIVNQETENVIRTYNEKNFSNVKITYIKGGKERQNSVKNAIDYLKNNTDFKKVIIHDAARPFVTSEIISDLYCSLELYKCASAAIPVVDTIKRLAKNKIEYLDRNNCYMIQTPQGFDINTLYESHQKALADNLTFTDDSSLCEYYGHEIYLSSGSIINFKITYPTDIKIAHKISQMF